MTSIKRYSLTLIIAAAIIIEMIGAVQYFMARSGVRNEVLDKAGRDMRESQRVAYPSESAHHRCRSSFSSQLF